MKDADWLTEYLQTTVQVVEYVLPLLAGAGKTEQVYAYNLVCNDNSTASSALLLLYGYISSYSRVLALKTTALQMVAC